MRIYLDLDSRALLSTPNRSIRGLGFKRRDNDSLELQFVRNGTVVSVPSATTVQYGLKPVDQYASGFFSTGSFTKTGSGEAAVFTAVLTLNTQPIEQAFDLEPKSIAAMLEIELRDGDTVASSVTLPVTIANDVIRGDEATPEAIPDGKATQGEAQAGIDNSKWMTPLRTKQAITQAADAITPADIGAAAATNPNLTGTLTLNSLDGAAADFYVGPGGNVGLGTESPTERLTISGNIDMLGGKIMNLHAPDSADDAVRLADLDARVPSAPGSGTFSLQCVDGVVSWVGA
jgi:hypothetical protein